MNASFAIIIHKNKILLFHRDDIPTIPHPDCWQLPGGGIEEGETPLQGLERELDEEVSFVPSQIHFIAEVQNKDSVTHLYISFVDDGEAKKFRHGSGEGQEIGFFTIDQALKLKLSPALKNRFLKSKREIEEAMKNKTVPTNIFL